MESVKWTEQQQQAIQEKGSNILVAAAAGSGKTTVLVERIIQKVMQEEVNVDELLVVTFTNAAAAEIRERVLEAIYKKLEEQPNHEHLQKQVVLLNKANICTIDAFCLTVIRNYFYEIDISPDFRIADNAEIELLKLEVIEEVFEELYEENNKDFLDLLEIYTSYKGDQELKDLILDLYRQIQSSPFPFEWLHTQIEKFNLKNEIEKDFSETEWGKILLEEYKENLQQALQELTVIRKQMEKETQLAKYAQVIEKDIEVFQEILQSSNSWDHAYECSYRIKFVTWPTDKKIVSEMKEMAKEKRKRIRENFRSFRDKTFIYSSKEALQDLYEMYPILVKLEKLICQFELVYTKEKQEKNILDFNDIEHYALQVLLQKVESGSYVPTIIAKQYQEKFKEIAIDEYQDSNLVQEYILSSISNGKNLYMVGDVKQSIYKFRQARPELFLQKYETYQKKEEKQIEDNLKIQLFHNFRSRKNILNFANFVFANIMSRKLGDIEYTPEEYLNYKASYPESEQADNEIEFLVIDKKEETDLIEEEEETENIEETELEAKLVAYKIKELIQSKSPIWDRKQGWRPIQYKDVVILLRATAQKAPLYEKAILELDMPVFSDTSERYLEAIEIETMMNVLKIIDNPMQDIPLVAVLRSSIGNFTDNELLEIRLKDSKRSFYESLLKVQGNITAQLENKIQLFLEQLSKWREKQEYLSLDELIWEIYLDSGYYYYVGLMPNGSIRQANLRMLFERAKQYEQASFKGLFNFIRFMDRLKKSNGDLGTAKLIGENENVIRIMSIHKSKGLEFPVVFLSNIGKKFNMQDLNKNIIFHQELGLGMKYKNYEKKIEYNTLAKEAIRIQLKRDNLSEEMRILYVALTRSKERLFLTGMAKNVEKELEKKQSFLETQNTEEMVSPLLLKKYTSYLDWIELIYLNAKKQDKKILKMKTYTLNELREKWSKKEKGELKIESDEILNINDDLNSKLYQSIKEKLEWVYSKEEMTKVPGKMSVSQLKEIKQKQILERPFASKVNFTKPKFLGESIELSKAEIGTIMHLAFQKLEFKKEQSLTDIQKMVQGLVEKEIITQLQAEAINIEKIYWFTKTNLANRIRHAKEVYKEIPFYTYIDTKEIYETSQTEKILVQGMIDLYFIEEGELILVDYKTDVIQIENELIQRHKLQLEQYKKALEKATGKKVKEMYLYSTHLNKEILVE